MVDAYECGVEVISTEDMNATWEEPNMKNEGWTPGSWWKGIEDEEFITCGKCWESEEELCKCKFMNEMRLFLMDGNATYKAMRRSLCMTINY